MSRADKIMGTLFAVCLLVIAYLITNIEQCENACLEHGYPHSESYISRCVCLEGVVVQP